VSFIAIISGTTYSVSIIIIGRKTVGFIIVINVTIGSSIVVIISIIGFCVGGSANTRPDSS